MKKIIIIWLLTVGLFLVSLCAQDYAPQQEEAIVLPKVEYKADGLKDPFEGYEEEQQTQETSRQQQVVKPLPALTVQGLVWGSQIPQVIINNQVLKVGDSINEVKIVRIDKDGVEVLYYGKSYFVSSPASAAIGSLQPTTENQNTGR